MAAKMLSRDSVRATAANVFFPSGNTGGTVGDSAPMSGMKRSIIGYRLPSTATAEERLIAMAALTLCGRSTNGDVKNWQCFILSFTALAFPETIKDLREKSDGEISFVDYSSEYITTLSKIETTLEADPKSRVAIPFPDELPIGAPTIGVAELNCASITGCYGYYSLMVHLMGKRITAETRENITIRRPGNLIDGFHAKEDEFILRGEGRMSDHAHPCINTAWDLMTSAKLTLVPKFAQFDRATTVPGQMVYMLFTLLKNSGMQPAALVHQLITAFPWIDEIPMLRPEYDLYVKSLTDYAALPATLRPYLKVMYGNTTRIFHAKSLANLTACAVMFLETSTPSLSGYTAPGGEAAKATFLYELKKRGLKIGAPPTKDQQDATQEVV